MRGGTRSIVWDAGMLQHAFALIVAAVTADGGPAPLPESSPNRTGLAADSPAVGESLSGTTGYWRNAEHGGINALYVLLRVYGYSGSYDAAIAAGHRKGLPSTVADLAGLSRALGYPLAVRRFTAASIRGIPLPAIVHLDGDSPTSGAYLVLIGCLDEEIMYMNGPSATIHYMDNESFYRRWGGVALVPTSSVRRQVADAATGMVIGLAGGLICRHLRMRNANAAESKSS